MIQVQPYQARIPISGGGGVSRIDTSNTDGGSAIIQALYQIGQAMRQEKKDDLGRRQAEANIAYRQKATSLLGQPRTAGQTKQPSGKIVTGGGTTWLINPQTGEKVDLGIPAPKSEASLALIKAWQGILPIEGEQLNPQEQAIKDVLGQRVMGNLGLEQFDIPGEKRKRFGIDWLAKDIPPRKGYRMKGEGAKQPSPLKEALQKTEEPQAQAEAGSVTMTAPDGKEYLVPAGEVKEAEKHGWKRSEAPAKKTTGKAGKDTVPEWMNLGKRATASETAARLGVSKQQSAEEKMKKMGVKTGPRPGSVGEAIAAAGEKTPTTTKEKTKKSKTVGKTGLTPKELSGLQDTGNFKLLSSSAISGVKIERVGGQAGELMGAEESAGKIADALSKTYPSAIGPKLTYREIMDCIREFVYQETKARAFGIVEKIRGHARTFGGNPFIVADEIIADEMKRSRPSLSPQAKSALDRYYKKHPNEKPKNWK